MMYLFSLLMSLGFSYNLDDPNNRMVTGTLTEAEPRHYANNAQLECCETDGANGGTRKLDPINLNDATTYENKPGNQ